VSIARSIDAGDIGLFDYVDSQTSDDDRRSLLAIHSAIARRLRTFTYLEIGSHLGGSLQAFVADARCRRIVSIDPRPASQPDDRGMNYDYDDNSTDRMLALLKEVPDADLTKLGTIELSTEDIAVGQIARPDLCFIDGEHTHAAALRDARFCRATMHGAGVVLFHDRFVIQDTVVAFARETPGPMTAYPMRGSIFVVEIGSDVPLLRNAAVAARVAPPAAPLWNLASILGANQMLLSSASRLRRLRHQLAR